MARVLSNACGEVARRGRAEGKGRRELLSTFLPPFAEAFDAGSMAARLLLRTLAKLALSVALATVVNLIIEELRLQKRLEVVNAAVNHTQNMLVWWSSLSIVDRRTRKKRRSFTSASMGNLAEEVGLDISSSKSWS